MTSAKQIQNPVDNLPLLTEVVGEGAADDFPILTEVAATDTPVAGVDEAQRILRQLEAYLETEFAAKLALRIEELQQQALRQAIDELKAELPGLLRNALSVKS